MVEIFFFFVAFPYHLSRMFPNGVNVLYSKLLFIWKLQRVIFSTIMHVCVAVITYFVKEKHTLLANIQLLSN